MTEGERVANIVLKYFSASPQQRFECFEDIAQEAALAKAAGGTFSDMLRAASTFYKAQVVHRGLVGGTGDAKKILNQDDYAAYSAAVLLDEVPVLPLARFIYSLQKKHGKRGRHSAVLKAFILSMRADGVRFIIIAEKLNISRDNCIRHYRRAWTLIKNFLLANAENMLSEYQKQLLNLVIASRRDVKEADGKGGYYDFSRRY